MSYSSLRIKLNNRNVRHPMSNIKTMKIKRALRIIFIFAIIYLIAGFILPYILNATIGGVHSIFREFAMNQSDALIALFAWPVIFFFLASVGGGLLWLLIPVFSVIVLWWIAYFIEKKLFPRKQTI